jgi:hypothetical protein
MSRTSFHYGIRLKGIDTNDNVEIANSMSAFLARKGVD